eukprot:m.51416 g.51416  ORF g.51416 m.51416 type:complete len:101 (+) comp34137_c0_seq2:146-448(+)
MSTARLQPKGHSGFLTKRGGQFKNWKRRWFQIKGDVLFYYKTPTDTQESGYIPLAGNQVLRHPVDPKTPDRHMFEIACKTNQPTAVFNTYSSTGTVCSRG